MDLIRVALDATYALDNHPSGVARYSEELIRELAGLPGIEMTLCARWPRFLKLGRRFAGSGARTCWLPGPFNRRLARAVDLFHGLNQRLPGRRFRRQVITVHDVFPLTSERYSTAAFRARFTRIISDAVARADRILCVSAYTRDELCRVLPVRREICAVIHHGVRQEPPPSPASLERARGLAAPFSGGAPFFLAVGAVQVRKNTQAAAEAVARLPARHKARLLVAGSAGHGSREVRDFIEQRGLAGRVRMLGYTDPETLAALYATAAALLFPSLEEGFGLPALEAMARGLPVIASNTGSLPEVCGDAAILVDPSDIEAMSRAALRLLEDEAWRDNWRERGLARARLFTWQRTAQATLDAYRALC